MLVACPAELSSYLYRLCTLCVHLSVLGGGIHPITMIEDLEIDHSYF
jgi:hypothetical protein